MKPYIILVLLIVLAFSSSLKNTFIEGDDYVTIVNNPHIAIPFSDLPSIFTKSFGEMTAISSQSLYYRPIFFLFHIITYRIWGINPLGFHLTNIIFHTVSVIFLYRIGLLLFDNNRLTALIAASIFAIHPVHNETVGRVVGLDDSLYGSFIVISLYFFLKEKNTFHCLHF